MRAGSYSFKMHKAGHRPGEYEDALHINEATLDGLPLYRFAVADGATESMLSGPWASILALAFAEGIFDTGMDNACLAPLRQQWIDQIPSGPKPWFIQEKLQEGSYAALAGLILFSSVENPTRGLARLRAVGDCCIFQLRTTGYRSFPLRHSSEFTARPMLLGTAPRALPPGSERTVDWRWKLGDTFLLMSDALAAWYMHQLESNGPHRDFFSYCQRHPDEGAEWFYDIIEQERASKSIKNDDVTLIVVRLAE